MSSSIYPVRTVPGERWLADAAGRPYRIHGDTGWSLWILGGDRNPGDALTHVNALAAGIREHDQRHLFTAHVLPECCAADEYARGGWVELNNTYTYTMVHRKLLADYNRKPSLPFFLMESTYEGEHNATEVQIRRQAYWAILCGATGQFFGNLPIWGFWGRGADMSATLFARNEGHDHETVCAGWETALDLPGSRDMTRHKALFDARPWHLLVPDQEHRVIRRGLGEYNGMSYLTAARATDGSTVVAYLPDAREIEVEMDAITGTTVRAWWFDPRTGVAHGAGDHPAHGRVRFTPPGGGDWVFVADDAGRGYPPPGER